jgi:hypothetical protein
MLGLAIMRYVLTQCTGKAADARRERLVSAGLGAHGIREPSPEQLRDARRTVKKGLAVDERLVEKFAPLFLIGKPCSFRFSDIEPLINKAKGQTRRRTPSGQPRS